MKRVINQMTADETVNTTGFKTGDIGTGGRTYVNHYKRDAPQAGGARGDNTTMSKCCFFTSIIIAVGLLIYVESALLATSGALEEALTRAIPLEGASQVQSSHNGKLVFVKITDTPKLVGAQISDDFFGISFPSSEAIARRSTEYCQWQEMEHTREVSEGIDNRDGKEKYRKETSYTYHKGWRTNKINSMLFDNPTAYHNPQRDPAPSKDFYSTGGVDLTGGVDNKNSLIMSSQDFQDALHPYEIMTLYKDQVKQISKGSLQEGFSEADHRYVYSRVPKDGWTGVPAVRAAASYLIDGVVDASEISAGVGFDSLLEKAGLDWITKGTCTAGDIRVHFESRQLPSTASVLAQVSNGGKKLVPFTYANGYTKVFATPNAMELQAMAKKIHGDQRWWTNVYRAGIALICLIGAFVGSDLYAPGSGTIPLFGFISTAALGGVWAYLYGAEKKPVIAVLVVASVLAVFIFLQSRKSAGNTVGSSSSSSSGGQPQQQQQQQQDNKASYNATQNNNNKPQPDVPLDNKAASARTSAAV